MGALRFSLGQVIEQDRDAGGEQVVFRVGALSHSVGWGVTGETTGPPPGAELGHTWHGHRFGAHEQRKESLGHSKWPARPGDRGHLRIRPGGSPQEDGQVGLS